MQVTKDKYSGLYFLNVDKLSTAMTFSQLEDFVDELQNLLGEVYMADLESEMGFLDDEGECDGCTI